MPLCPPVAGSAVVAVAVARAGAVPSPTRSSVMAAMDALGGVRGSGAATTTSAAVAVATVAVAPGGVPACSSGASAI